MDIEVYADISQLKEVLYKILPEEKDIKVTPTNDNVTLSGTVSSTSNLSQALSLAETYYPKKVVNLLEVAWSTPGHARSAGFRNVSQPSQKAWLQFQLSQQQWQEFRIIPAQ